jgi:nucleotide-binding universal stress UspA family protein
MISFKKILVPVDFSEPSKKAVTYGLTLAAQFNGKLILAHIVPESSALTYAFPTEMLNIEREQREKATREIEKLVPPQYAAQLALQTIVRVAPIDAELLRIVKDEAVDLVVMGTHGRRSLGRAFLGSVTERMLRRVAVPVLTVSHIEPEKHSIGLVSLKRILYATDLSESTNTGLKYAIEVARLAGAQLIVVHIVSYPDLLLWGPALVMRIEDERAKVVQDMRKKLGDLVTLEKPKEMKIETLVLEGKPFEKILEIAEDRGTDMIILNVQSKSGLERALLGSTAERVVRLARIPVLSIPVSQNETYLRKHKDTKAQPHLTRMLFM